MERLDDPEQWESGLDADQFRAPARRGVGAGSILLMVALGLWTGFFCFLIVASIPLTGTLALELAGVIALGGMVAWIFAAALIRRRSVARRARAVAVLLVVFLACVCLPTAVIQLMIQH